MSVAEVKKNWNVSDLMEWSIRYMSEKNFDNPRLNVEWLLCHTLQCKRIDLYANYDRPLDKKELSEFKTQLLRRVDQEPLQYIIGSAEFMGLTFEVSPDVLIPRQDTETLVEKCIEICAKNKNDEPLRIFDIGTGSGAIGISLAYYLSQKGIPHIVTALDISKEALAVAQKNAKRILSEDKIEFIEGDIFNENTLSRFYHAFDLIVSNPPYISETEYALLPQEIRDYEPTVALKAEDDGLCFYKQIAGSALKFFRSNLPKKTVLFEVGYRQAIDVRRILTQHRFEVEVFKDYHQIERVVCGTLKTQN